MAKIQPDKFPEPLLYCPECQKPVVYFGTVHKKTNGKADNSKNMVRCLNEACGCTVQPEQALELIETSEGKMLYNAGFDCGEDAGLTESLSDTEDLDDIGEVG